MLDSPLIASVDVVGNLSLCASFVGCATARRCRSTAAVDVTGAARSRRSHVVLLSTLTSMGEVVAAVVLARRSVIPTQFLVPPFPSAAHETRQCAGSGCTERGVFVDEVTGAYYCDVCWSRVVVDSLMLAASGVMQGTVDIPLQPPHELSDAPSDEESISAFRTKLGQFLKS